MDFKKNKQFFINKKNSIYGKIIYGAYAFYVLAVIAAFANSIGGRGFYVNLYGALIFAIPGVIIHMVVLSMTTSESYIKQQISKEIDRAEEKALELLDYPDNDPDKFFKMRGHDLLSEGVLLRKIGDKYYSTRYSLSYILLEKDKVKVCTVGFSIVEDQFSEKITEIPYKDIKKAELVMKEVPATTIDGKEHLVRTYTFYIYGKDGSTLLSIINREDSSDIDRLIETLDRYAVKFSQ